MHGNPYESDELLQQYLVFHYARPEEQFPWPYGAADALNFPARCASEALDEPSTEAQLRALDLGCGVGRATFELARACGGVIGIDFSQAFVDAAATLARDGKMPCRRHDEGGQWTELEIAIDPEIDRTRVSFEQGDAMDLRVDLGTFDLVLACNLICRLPEPMKFLRRLPELVKPGGRLFITTPFTWLEDYTPRENWLGCGAADSFDGLKSALEPEFSLERTFDMPFLIREHARKFQYSVAQASCWTRV